MLTPKQEKFCIEYAKCGNARQAYINAGYIHKKDSTTDAAASRLLSNVKVKDRLAELAEEVKNNSIADIQEMQRVLTAIIRQEANEEVIVLNSIKGTFDKTNKKPALKEVISAIEKLGKMQGAFTEKIDINTEVGVTIVDDLTE